MDGNTPLHFATGCIRWGLTQALLDQKAAVDPLNHKQQTPLYQACCNYQNQFHQSVDRIHLINQLLDRGANVNQQDASGDTVLHRALRGRLIKVAQLLIDRGADPQAQTRYGHTTLLLAIQPKFRPCTRPRTPDRLLVSRLLACQVDVNAASQGRVTPLVAALNGGHETTIQQLLDHGTDVNLQDAIGCSPLHGVLGICQNSCSNDHSSEYKNRVTSLLLQHRADVHLPNIHGQTCMDIAQSCRPLRHLMYHHTVIQGQVALLSGWQATCRPAPSMQTHFFRDPLFDRNLLQLIWGFYRQPQPQPRSSGKSIHKRLKYTLPTINK
jgi:ankyrin repeat protein